MKSSQPFHDFHHELFLKKRFAPIVAFYVDESVDRLMDLSGLTFLDFISPIAAKENPPIRVADLKQMQQVSQDAFFSETINNTTLFSQSFIFEEFEKSDTVNPKLSPEPGRLKEFLHYPSGDSMNPPWYRVMVEHLAGSLLYSDFAFYDFPCAIVYVSLSGQSSFIPYSQFSREVNQLLPPWMSEFIHDLKVIHLVVYDGLFTSEVPADAKGSANGYDRLLSLKLRTQQAGPTSIDKIDLKSSYFYDQDLLSNPNFCQFLSPNDIQAVQTLFSDIRKTIISPYFDLAITTLELEIETNKQIKNRLKSMFSKSSNERSTRYMQLPWKAIIYLKLAGHKMNLGKYIEAQHQYHEFLIQIEKAPPTISPLKVDALFMAALCCTTNTVNFRGAITETLSNISLAKSVRTLLLIPILAAEIHAASNEWGDAAQLLRIAIDKARRMWQGDEQIKGLFLALLYERFSGVTENERYSLLHLSRAAYLYLACKQVAHALRCYIWLSRSLPEKSWPLLKQTTELEKASILCHLSQFSRAIDRCKDLLALPDLCPVLHEKVVSRFWTPFNDPSFAKQKNVRVNSLLEVKKLSVIDQSSPEFYPGIIKDDFIDLMHSADEWWSNKLSRSYSRNLDSWYDDNSKHSKRGPHEIGVGREVTLVIYIHNRYVFSVHLDHAQLSADFSENSNDAPSDSSGKCDIEVVHSRNVPGPTPRNKPQSIPFKFTASSPGFFYVNKFLKNYWGFVDTEAQCSPLVLHAVQSYPIASLSIVGVPSTMLVGQCQEVSVILRNDGDSPIVDAAIAYDTVADIFTLNSSTEVHPIDFGVLVSVPDIPPHEEQALRLLLHPLKEGDFNAHFIGYSRGIRLGFAVVKITVLPPFVLDAAAEPLTRAIHIHMTSGNPELMVDGVIDRNCKKLKLLIADKKPPFAKPVAFVALEGKGEEEGVEDKEKLRLMRGAEFALLYHYEEKNCLLPIAAKMGKNGVKCTAEAPMKVKVGEEAECRVKVENVDENEVYLVPDPFAELGGIIGALWIGVSGIKLSKDKGYEGVLRFRAVRPGIYTIKTFRVSKGPELVKYERVEVELSVQIFR